VSIVSSWCFMAGECDRTVTDSSIIHIPRLHNTRAIHLSP